MALGRAAAIGVTPLPLLTLVVPAEEPTEPCSEVGALPAMLSLLPPAVTLGALSLSSIARALRLVCVAASVASTIGVTTEFFVLDLDITSALPNLFQL